MAIIPCICCSNIAASVRFYTETLDLACVGGDDITRDPSFAVLSREGHLVFLSSHRGDGVFGNVIAVTVDDVRALFRKLRERGLQTPGNPDRPQEVHEGPIDQSWGTREFYVKDPDGNTIRFTQLLDGES